MVKLNNYARVIEKRGDSDWYRWKVFVDEPPQVLDEIESVEYELHPTFPEPHQTREDAADNFGLEASGWGEFTLVANVKYRNGKRERVPYALNLGKPWPETARA